MPETPAQPVVITPAKLFVGRFCVLLLLGMIFAVLFGDFVVWAFFGTRFLLSPRFQSLLPCFQGMSVILFFLFLEQSVRDWKQGKPHFILIGFFVFVIGAIPLADLTARVMPKWIAWTATAVLPPTYKPLLILILIFVSGLICKILALSKVWRIVAPVFEPQEQRRIVISD